ncbi:MAG: hypothetical protein PHU75_07070, partial [Candidatus Nanopelagicales bacterium]|nr:hypothetical protein [Candidatus Nanopelagicales bacterium]
MDSAGSSGRTRQLEVRGARLAFTDDGAGSVVLNAHGLTSSRANNRRMGLPDFGATVGRSHRVISYDARGHGESAGTDAPDDYTWAALAQDLLALADVLSPDAPVSVIGS